MTIESKIKQAIQGKKLKPTILGEINWCNYFISVTELVWAKNNHDGYQIDVYSDILKTQHLVSFKI